MVRRVVLNLKRCMLIVICGIMIFGFTACVVIPDMAINSCNHQWTGATCTSAAVCTKCGETNGTALGHQWSDATCASPAKCNICGTTNGSALNHVWQEANYAAPKTCQNCGETKGRIETYSNGTYGSWSRQYVTFRTWDVHPFIMSADTENCVSFTFTLSFWDITYGSPYGLWEVYCKKPNGAWVLIQTFDVQQNMTTVKVNFEEPMTFTEVAVNRLTEHRCTHKYQINVIEYSRYIE